MDLEGEALSQGVIATILQIVFTAALVSWGRWIARRHPSRFWRYAPWMPVVALVVYAVGIAATGFFLVRAFGAVSSAPASEKAQRLSEAIGGAMWTSAIGAGAALVLYVACVVAFLVGTLRKPVSLPRDRPTDRSP